MLSVALAPAARPGTVQLNTLPDWLQLPVAVLQLPAL
jgi:hypothetical protein